MIDRIAMVLFHRAFIWSCILLPLAVVEPWVWAAIAVLLLELVIDLWPLT